MRRLAFIFSPGYFFHLKCPKRGSRDLVSAALVGFVKLASHLRSGQGVRRGHSSGRRHEIDTRLRDPTRCHEAIPLSCGEKKKQRLFWPLLHDLGRSLVLHLSYLFPEVRRVSSVWQKSGEALNAHRSPASSAPAQVRSDNLPDPSPQQVCNHRGHAMSLTALRCAGNTEQTQRAA